VEGVFISGNLYPDATEAMADEYYNLGPSDKDGYIRWDGLYEYPVKPGAYELTASNSESSQPITVVMPKDKALADATIVWNPDAIVDAEPFEGTGLTGDEQPAVSSPENVVTFRIVDENGKPVSGLVGGLELTMEEYVAFKTLDGAGEEKASDESGELTVSVADNEIGLEYKLVLYGNYDRELKQQHMITLPAPPAVVNVRWTQDAPPAKRPAQSEGMRIYVVDPKGKPVEGVVLSGSPYPKEYEGPVPDIAMETDPSDGKGYIRWDSAKPGTYNLVASKGEESCPVTLVMPKDQTMADVAAVWKPGAK
jgi:hypothetical protein